MSLWSSSCNLDGSKNDSLCTGFQQSLDPLNNLQDPGWLHENGIHCQTDRLQEGSSDAEDPELPLENHLFFFLT